ncbi:MAG: hypothetical protein WAT39_07040 [Planctomycetota bacterium]
MTTLALDIVIDASRAPQGAAQAEQALKQVQAAATQTTASVQGASAAIAGTGVGGRPSLVTSAGQLNGAFSGTRQLLTMTASSLGQFGGAAGVAAQGLGLVASAWKAGPFGIIASVIAGAAGAFAYFSSQSKEATESVKRQATALDGLLGKLNEVRVRAGYGEAAPGASIGGTVDALTALRLSSNRDLSVNDVAGLYGLSEQDARYALGRSGMGESALELARPRAGNQYDQFFRRFEVNRVSREQAISAGELLLRDRQRAEAQARAGAESTGLYQFGAPNYSGLPASMRPGATIGSPTRDYVSQSVADQQRVAIENAQAAQRAMAELVATGERFGASLGDAFGAALQGAGSLRQILVQIASDWARSALSQAFARIGGQIAGSVFGQTKTQAANDAPGVTNAGGGLA